jgi:hypothetical protein
MAIVTLSTIYQTVFISIVLLLSKGWGFARNSLSRDDLSSVTVAMGATYLIYSAYFVSTTVEGLSSLLQLLLNSLYVILMTVVVKNGYETRRLLKEQHRVIYENNVEPLMPSVNLKVKLINQFIWIAAVYFGFEIIVNGLLPIV